MFKRSTVSRAGASAFAAGALNAGSTESACVPDSVAVARTDCVIGGGILPPISATAERPPSTPGYDGVAPGAGAPYDRTPVSVPPHGSLDDLTVWGT